MQPQSSHRSINLVHVLVGAVAACAAAGFGLGLWAMMHRWSLDGGAGPAADPVLAYWPWVPLLTCAGAVGGAVLGPVLGAVALWAASLRPARRPAGARRR